MLYERRYANDQALQGSTSYLDSRQSPHASRRSGKKWALGVYENITEPPDSRDSCPAHRLFLLCHASRYGSSYDATNFIVANLVSDDLTHDLYSTRPKSSSGDGTGKYWGQLLVIPRDGQDSKDTDRVQGLSIGRSLNCSYVDPDHPNCSRPSFQLTKRISWFIDTQQQSSVPGSNNMQHVALSYVWGQAAMLKTEKASLREHRQEGAFSRIWDSLAPTVRDAIALVPLIGERIYANKVLTIIAGDGDDANFGLRGILNSSLKTAAGPGIEP
ncbi:hypothetical protein B0T24DRAFT_711684 [Lasiosphaeria ovina]|uniref:Heterokaryon incompatibility domain-containing protein n=1 Tax=Lasiosphaeria ovina TaxID=92902 RepID=A0AAE0JY84_9PEZI|nr:hypothetical protein B0T24DRAFT_711684 [Lasiosphaeria ovina]